MIKAVIFDWGGVLIDNPAEELMAHCAAFLGTDGPTLKKALDPLLPEFQRGTISESEFWTKICTTLEINSHVTGSLWKEAVKKSFHNKQEVYQVVKNLRQSGFKTGFISNTELPAVEYFHENNYDRYFDATVFSCVEKTIKPEKEIYTLALERLGVTASEALFIDDKPELIAGAKNAGLHGVVFETVAQLTIELQKYIKSQS